MLTKLPPVIILPSCCSDKVNTEIEELLAAVDEVIEEYEPTALVVVDLHTTSADGGVFVISTEAVQSERIAKSLNAPVVKGLMKGIVGTSLHYFTPANLRGVETTAVCFEGGRHEDPASIARCIAALVNSLRSVGCVRPTDVESKHDELLLSYSKGLPKVVEIVYRYPVKPDAGFKMKPGYLNFQAVAAGEVLATDRAGEIVSPMDALILMPLYQPKGEDGFFLVKTIDEPSQGLN